MTEMDKLEQMLKDHSVKYRRTKDDFGEQIVAFDPDGTQAWDAVCNKASYGHDEGLLEIAYTEKEKNVQGWLTAADIALKMGWTR